VDISESEAFTVFERAAHLGDATAQYNAGVCLGKGRGVKQDLSKAAEWYEKAAEQGDAMAQFRLALCFAAGKVSPAFRSLQPRASPPLLLFRRTAQGIDKDGERAVQWYERAADQGHGGAIFNLGVCYSQVLPSSI
jgi:TPR repeat protein